MSFAIVTDSTSDISAELAAERGIDVVPLSVTIGDETMLDDTLTQTEFFERMASAPRLPTTSQPSVGAFVEVYERALAKAEEVLSIHISSKLSGTFDSATQAAAQFAGRVHVFDSRNLSWGLSLQVLEATAAAAQGLGIAATLERLESARDRTKLIVGLDSLDNLAKGGRIGKVSAFLGAMLDLKVTLTVDPTGAFQPVARSRGEKAALRHTLEWVSGHMGEHTRGRFAVGYAMKRERAEYLADQIRQRFDAIELHIYEAGSVISTHTGTGWGVALLPED
ncbi:MAG TPA: DegV family protein [Coriobacteriia bacterium]|nr:DegV family protein [Coriobacteriia bacterium]